MDEAEADVLATMTFPKDHWRQIYATNGLERVNGEVKRRANVVGIFPPPVIPSRFARRNLWPPSPNEDAIIQLIGAILFEQNDEWAVRRSRYMTLETIAPLSDDPIVRLSVVTAWPTRPTPEIAVIIPRQLHHATGLDRLGLASGSTTPLRRRPQNAGASAGTFAPRPPKTPPVPPG